MNGWNNKFEMKKEDSLICNDDGDLKIFTDEDEKNCCEEMCSVDKEHHELSYENEGNEKSPTKNIKMELLNLKVVFLM